VCQEFPVHCTNKCGLRDIPRKRLEVHVRDECPATEVQCEYKNLGCEEVFPRSNAHSHAETHVERHFDLALRGLETTHDQVRALASLVKEQSQKIQKLEKEMSKVNEQPHQIEKLEEDVSKVREHSKEIERLKKDISQVKAHTRQEEKLEKITENYAPFVWKIPHFQAVYERAVTGEQEVVLSEPFYLFKNGYKLKIKMMPNGGNTLDPVAHKEYKGRFLSLYIKVIPGEYDSILPWPFTEKVRVTLIDQYVRKDMRENISLVIDLGDHAYFRPVVEKDAEYGFPDFVSQDILRSRSYVKTNTIFIMASREYRT